VAGIAVPAAPASNGLETRVVEVIRAENATDAASLLLRRDDEWTIVIWDQKPSGGQCGGTSTTVASTSDGYKSFASGKWCADMDVSVNVGVAACTFNSKK
jgi:hypothetical protein